MTQGATFLRLSWLGLVLGAAYALALWQPVRALYAHVDKLAHGLAFAGVYAGLVWALRAWPWWGVALLAVALGALVEVHQLFLPGFTPSVGDWVADVVGVALAGGVHWGWMKWMGAGGVDSRLRGNDEGKGMSGAQGMLPVDEFMAAVRALPLVSVDWVLTNPQGQVLVGWRLNAPARGSWFTPGGRIRKGEALMSGLQRVAGDELGVNAEAAAQWASRATLMGAWDHMYPDAAFSPDTPTHYVNLPHWLALSQAEVDALTQRLPVGTQHSHWQWMPLAQAATQSHPNVQPYAQWLTTRLTQQPAN